ncbi:hypothetical protein [Kamptonema formosum]|nr:hypothetical protein [Oscillatoria sp. PCC 10802]
MEIKENPNQLDTGNIVRSKPQCRQAVQWWVGSIVALGQGQGATGQ